MTSPAPWSVLPMTDSLPSIRVKQNCRVIDINTSIPWDNPNNIISYETEQLMYMMHGLVFIPILFVIGAPLNILNMVVFGKQGLRDRINVCLFSLSLLDLTCLILLFAYNAARAYWRLEEGEHVDRVFRYMVDNSILGLYGIIYGPSFLSAIISTERCLCVLFPLKARQLISTKALVVAIVTGVVVLVVLRFVVHARLKMSCIFIEQTGTTEWAVSMSQFYFKNKALVDNLDSVFYGFIAGIGFLSVVIITTIITAVRLQQVVHWRRQSSSSMSTKEIGIARTIMCLSVEFVILSIPMSILRFSHLLDPELSPAGKYRNFYKVLVGLGELSMYTSSVVNFFVYYFSSSKYRETLYTLLPLQQAKEKRKPQTSTGSLRHENET